MGYAVVEFIISLFCIPLAIALTISPLGIWRCIAKQARAQESTERTLRWLAQELIAQKEHRADNSSKRIVVVKKGIH